MYYITCSVYKVFLYSIDMSVINAKQGFRHVAVAREQGQVWAVSGAGILCRRIGISDENPAGTGWATGIGVSLMLYDIIV